jgi:hypothetical protein
MRASIIEPETEFGKLTVVKWDKERKAYLCKCKCGNETYARSWSLKTGRHKACKCGMKEVRLSCRLPDNLAIKNHLYYDYKKSAQKKKKPFNLSFEDFIKLIQTNCHYCGIEPQQRGLKREIRGRDFAYNGIDRVDNNIGYIEGNCVACCEQCNNSKKNLTLEQWLEWIKRITSFQANKLLDGDIKSCKMI